MATKKAHKPKGAKNQNNSQEKEAPVVDSNAFNFSSDPQIGDVQRKIVSVFEMFDPGNQKIVDVREVGCIVRALGITPINTDKHIMR